MLVCVCVEKAAKRAECQPSAHVVDIRNQTAANRLQVRPAMAFTRMDTWQQQQAVALEGRQRRAKVETFALVVEELEVTVFIVGPRRFKQEDKCLAYRCLPTVFSCPRV